MKKFYGIKVKGTDELLGYCISSFLDEGDQADYNVNLNVNNGNVWLTDSKMEAERIANESPSMWNGVDIPKELEGKLEVVEVKLTF